MFNALLYLTWTSQRNRLAGRLRRLRHPKYLLGAAAGIAYFYYFVFGFAYRSRAGAAGLGLGLPAGRPDYYAPFAAAILFTIVLLGWIFGRDRAALKFTEAETAFLFPAPLSRRGLLHYQLLRSQLRILFSAFLLSFIFRRGAFLGGSTVLHATGWWLILSTLNLHFLGLSFLRERLFELGLTWWRRCLLMLAGLALLGLAWWLVARQGEAARGLAVHENMDMGDYAAWARRLLQLPPLSWLLVPFSWLVRPYLATDVRTFFLALGPAVLLLVAHYYWVMRSAVGFEEASIDLAAKQAQLITAYRAGKLTTSRKPPRKRPAPFPLRATGWAPPAFLWKSLIALGPFYRLRNWLLIAMGLVCLTGWLGRDPDRAPYLTSVIAASIMAGGYLLFFGPLIMRRNVVVILDQMEMTKSYPLPGWQVIAGELLTPGVVITLVEWLFLLAIIMASANSPNHSKFSALVSGGFQGAASIALLVPPLIALMLCLPLALMLYFPAWVKPAGAPGEGVEMAGQGIIVMLGYVVVLLVSLLPAAVVGGLAYFLTQWLVGGTAAFSVALLIASGGLVFELLATIWWLGEKLGRFDLSQEMPR